MSAELARIADYRTSTTGGEFYRNPSIKYLRELSLAHPFAVRAMLICKFFPKGWQIELAPEDDCDVPNEAANNEDGIELPHAVTFFRPDKNLERHHTGLASPVSLGRQSPSRLRFSPFPLQGTHLGSMALKP